MALTVPDPPLSGAWVLRSVDGVVTWVEAMYAPPPPSMTGEFVNVFSQGSYQWKPLTSVRGPSGLMGLRGAVGPGGSRGADGRSAPTIRVNLVNQ